MSTRAYRRISAKSQKKLKAGFSTSKLVFRNSCLKPHEKLPIGTCTERLSTRVHGKRWHAPLGNMLFPGSHKLRALFLTVMFFRMGSDGKYEPSELAKISFEDGCQFFSLKVPKGFDVKKLKV